MNSVIYKGEKNALIKSEKKSGLSSQVMKSKEHVHKLYKDTFVVRWTL